MTDVSNKKAEMTNEEDIKERIENLKMRNNLSLQSNTISLEMLSGFLILR